MHMKTNEVMSEISDNEMLQYFIKTFLPSRRFPITVHYIMSIILDIFIRFQKKCALFNVEYFQN